MAKVRRISPEFEFAVFDGRIVGVFDQVSGMVMPETAPAWFDAERVREVETLKMLEVVEGEFVKVSAGDLFRGEGGKWRKVEAGARILRDPAGQILVVSAYDFLHDYEPA